MLLHWWTLQERVIIGQEILLIFICSHLVRIVFFSAFSVLSSCAYIFSLNTHFSLCLKTNSFLHSVPSDMNRNRHLIWQMYRWICHCRAKHSWFWSRGKSKFFLFCLFFPNKLWLMRNLRSIYMFVYFCFKKLSTKSLLLVTLFNTI